MKEVRSKDCSPPIQQCMTEELIDIELLGEE
jgi:hypothetical protein